MSYDLDVYVPDFPRDLKRRWEEAIASCGFTCELRPDFDPDRWIEDTLLAKAEVRPRAFLGAKRYAKGSFRCGSLLSIRTDFQLPWNTKSFPKRIKDNLKKARRECFFTTSMNRTVADFRFQVLAAATFAQLTKGVLHDPQEGRCYTGTKATEKAMLDAASYEQSESALLGKRKTWPVRPFRDWKTVLKSAGAFPEGRPCGDDEPPPPLRESDIRPVKEALNREVKSTKHDPLLLFLRPGQRAIVDFCVYEILSLPVEYVITCSNVRVDGQVIPTEIDLAFSSMKDLLDEASREFGIRPNEWKTVRKRKT